MQVQAHGPSSFSLIPGQKVHGRGPGVTVEVTRQVKFTVSHDTDGCVIECEDLGIQGVGRQYNDAWRDFSEALVDAFVEFADGENGSSSGMHLASMKDAYLMSFVKVPDES